ncbi:hypothetical protein EV424DRAFT_1549047 [Suillus variegatus]|nr:hypothetical protein EV424DRAFT_1549047 [Suillus variegatus]
MDRIFKAKHLHPTNPNDEVWLMDGLSFMALDVISNIDYMASLIIFPSSPPASASGLFSFTDYLLTGSSGPFSSLVSLPSHQHAHVPSGYDSFLTRATNVAFFYLVLSVLLTYPADIYLCPDLTCI